MDRLGHLNFGADLSTTSIESVCRSGRTAPSLITGLKRASAAVCTLISGTVLRLLAMPAVLVPRWNGVRWSAHGDLVRLCSLEAFSQHETRLIKGDLQSGGRKGPLRKSIDQTLMELFRKSSTCKSNVWSIIYFRLELGVVLPSRRPRIPRSQNQPPLLVRGHTTHTKKGGSSKITILGNSHPISLVS